MLHSQQQQDDSNAAVVDDYEFASIFADDLSWLGAFAIPSSAQLALVADEAMSPCAQSTLLEALEKDDRGNNPYLRPTAAIPSISDEQRQLLEQTKADNH